MQIRLSLQTSDIQKIILTWNIELQAGEIIDNFAYNIQISASKNGDWLNVNQSPIYNAYGYIDDQTQRGFMNNGFYYRIQAQSIDGTKFYYSNLVHVDESETNYIANFISKQEQRALRRLNGQKALLFSRKKFGPRCSCYDVVMKKRIVQNCPDCFNTTFEGGYFQPYLIWVNRDVRQISIDNTENAVIENPLLSAWTSNDAIIEPNDVIVFLNTKNERFVVGPVNPTKFQGCTVRQILQLIQRPLDSEIYTLPFNEDDYKMEEYNVFRRSWTSK